MSMSEFRFVCGFVCDLRVDLELHPLAFRRQQREIVDNITLDGWEAVIPERYSDQPDDSRPSVDDTNRLRSWDDQSVGTTRLPVGLVRLVDNEPRTEIGLSDIPDRWQMTSRYVAMWPGGAGVAVLNFRREEIDDINVSEMQEAADSFREELTEEAIDIANRTVEAIVSALGTTTIPANLPAAGTGCRYVGRHRLWRLGADPSPGLLTDIRDHLVLVGGNSRLLDVCGDGDRFCYAGNGVSVEISRSEAELPSLLAPVLDYYEYWIATVSTMDDELHSEYAALARGRRDDEPERGRTVSGTRLSSTDLQNRRPWEDTAQELFFAHRDVINAMSPSHLVAWNSYVATWRISELEEDVREKILAVEGVSRRRREEESNSIAFWTTTVVTFLAALTLIGIVTGVAAFVIADGRLSYPLRVGLVGLSLLTAVILFMLTFRPTAIHLIRLRR